jgi:hypothetical protein
MALFNEILSGRYNRALQKLFGMKGGPPSPQLAGEIAATISMFYGVENRYLENWSTFGGASAVTAGGAQFAAVRVRNPLNSGMVAVFHKVSISFGVLDNLWQLGRGSVNTDLTTIIQVPDFDLRNGGKASSSVFSAQTNFASQAAALPAGNNAIWAVNLPANTLADYITFEAQEIPLLPGGYVQLTGGIAAEQMTTVFNWRERPLEDSEKT